MLLIGLGCTGPYQDDEHMRPYMWDWNFDLVENLLNYLLGIHTNYQNYFYQIQKNMSRNPDNDVYLLVLVTTLISACIYFHSLLWLFLLFQAEDGSLLEEDFIPPQLLQGDQGDTGSISSMEGILGDKPKRKYVLQLKHM